MGVCFLCLWLFNFAESPTGVIEKSVSPTEQKQKGWRWPGVEPWCHAVEGGNDHECQKGWVNFFFLVFIKYTCFLFIIIIIIRLTFTNEWTLGDNNLNNIYFILLLYSLILLSQPIFQLSPTTTTAPRIRHIVRV